MAEGRLDGEETLVDESACKAFRRWRFGDLLPAGVQVVNGHTQQVVS